MIILCSGVRAWVIASIAWMKPLYGYMDLVRDVSFNFDCLIEGFDQKLSLLSFQRS